MYIKKIVIEKIKCFGPKDKFVALDMERPGGGFAGWTVIAGRNGSGKSTFLQSIALAIAGPGAARALQESFSRWVTGGEGLGGAEVELVMENMEKSQISTHVESGTVSPSFEVAEVKQNTEPELYWGDHNENAVNIALTEEKKGPWMLTPKGWFIAGYGPFRRLSLAVSKKEKRPLRVEQLVSLFKEDESLVESVSWLKEKYLQRLEGQDGAKELEDNVLELLGDGLLPGGLKVKKIDSEGLWVEQSDSKLEMSLNQLSDGYRTVAALVLDIVRQLFKSFGEFKITKENGICQALYPGVVLIDEMDTHLHVSWQQKIGFWLKSRFPRIQFIVSTHSPFICQAADPKGLIKLPGIGEPGKAEHVGERLYRTVINGTADDAVLSELFGLDTPYSSQADKIRDEVAQLEAAIFRGRADAGQKTRYEELKKQLPNTQLSQVEQILRGLDKDK